jgi:hypothetical protein
MDLLRVQSLICAYLAARAAELGLDAARLQVRYVLNWGGFVNRSFRVMDGRAVLHLKLAADPEIRAGLRRFWELRPLMAERYRAPAPAAWIEVPGTAYAGVLSPWIDGDGDYDRRDPAVREAGAAKQEARQGILARGENPAEFERNRLARCDKHTGDDRDYCIRRMNGEGTISGSVEGGGIYRELRVQVPAD